MTITQHQLDACVPSKDGLLDAINATLDKYNITETNDIAMFIAQCSHESGDFVHLTENLNYRAASLIATWPKHFDEATAAACEHNQVKIANRVYSNRMGNSDEASGDGWKYHGRGAIQLTGKATYQQYADSLGLTLQETIASLETLAGAVDSAGWFFSTHNICGKDITQATKLINGGVLGLDDRKARFEKCLSALS